MITTKPDLIVSERIKSAFQKSHIRISLTDTQSPFFNLSDKKSVSTLNVTLMKPVLAFLASGEKAHHA